jgi:hypothetical protein
VQGPKFKTPVPLKKKKNIYIYIIYVYIYNIAIAILYATSPITSPTHSNTSPQNKQKTPSSQKHCRDELTLQYIPDSPRSSFMLWFSETFDWKNRQTLVVFKAITKQSAHISHI